MSMHIAYFYTHDFGVFSDITSLFSKCCGTWGGKKPQTQARTTLPELPVLDVRSLKPSQIKQAKKIFERFKAVEFKPANEAWNDEARQELDRAVLTELLNLQLSDFESSMKTLRNQWCEEPSVHGGKSTAPN